jgi:predicted lipid-binding transport protein (Tim44 family)
MLQRLLASLAAVAVIVLGFFFLTIALVLGAVLALVIGLRIWWVMRKLKGRRIIIEPGAAHMDPGAPAGGAIEGEFQVVERESGKRQLPIQ